MLVSYEWLSQYVDLDGITPEDIAEEMNRTGIEVEVIYTRDPGVSGVVIGEVMSVEKHPQADKLKICMVNVGKGQILQIVCGAPNVAAGQRVPVALIGAKLPGGVHIKRAKLRGVESQGMICSAKELGFPEKVLMKEQTVGILVLEPDAPIGLDIKEFLGMNDQVIELQLTTNRSDCLGMFGVAYEVAAIMDRELNLPSTPSMPVSEPTLPIQLHVEALEDCPLYATQIVSDLKVGPSPQWLQNRLISAGVRPINNIVDITNYVMLETGQPLHAFDYEMIESGQIVVRRARPGEKVVTLDGVERTCDEEILLITDGDNALGVAGVMGGGSSEVTSETTTVLLEAAFFDPAVVRQGSKKLGLRTEASNRFEKGVDPEQIIPALNRAVQLLCQLCGGKVVSNPVVHKEGDVEDVVIDLRHDRIVHLLGVHLEEEEVMDIFRRLRFQVTQKEGVYEVQVPTRRPDIMLEVDLIEEVARLYGYDRIPTTLPWGQQPPGGLTQEQKLRRIVRHTLSDLGLTEVVTYSLTTREADQEVASLHPEVHPIQLAMPMSNEHTILRTVLVPSLVRAAHYNQNRGNERISIFELGRVFLTHEATLSKLPEERLHLAGLFTGEKQPSVWKQPSYLAGDFFVVKGILEALFNRLGLNEVSYRESAPHGYHPGRTAVILVDEEPIGFIGELHPTLAEKYDLEHPVVFELDLDKIFSFLQQEIVYKPISRYPAVTRDLAVIVDEEIPVGELEEGIRKVGGELLKSVALFDVFTGEPIGEGLKNVAFSLLYQAEDRTLTDEEVQEVHGKILRYLEDVFQAKLRQ